MLRHTLLLTAVLALTGAAPALQPAPPLLRLDLTPEEAQQYLASLPFAAPELSARTAVLPLVRWNDPQFRTAEAGPTLGHYWRNGHEIENTADYVEEVYDAAQYHGQDGLGAYAYGYKTPESSKVENRERSGDVSGSYSFRDGNNDLIKVKYWADSEGFHQEDNVPRDLPQETADVREARLAHEQAWNEAAAAAAANPDPQGEYRQADVEPNYSAQASEPQTVVAARDGRAYTAAVLSQPQNVQANIYSQQPGSFSQKASSSSKQSNIYSQQSSNYPQQYSSAQAQVSSASSHGQPDQEPEPTGPPRGFFYSYNYPVSVLVAKNEAHAGTPVDHDTVGVGAHRG